MSDNNVKEILETLTEKNNLIQNMASENNKVLRTLLETMHGGGTPAISAPPVIVSPPYKTIIQNYLTFSIVGVIFNCKNDSNSIYGISKEPCFKEDISIIRDSFEMDQFYQENQVEIDTIIQQCSIIRPYVFNNNIVVAALSYFMYHKKELTTVANQFIERVTKQDPMVKSYLYAILDKNKYKRGVGVNENAIDWNLTINGMENSKSNSETKKMQLRYDLVTVFKRI